MRKKQILLLKIGVVVWICVVYVMFIHKPATTSSTQVGVIYVTGKEHL